MDKVVFAQKGHLANLIEMINACVEAFDKVKSDVQALGGPGSELKEAVDRLREMEYSPLLEEEATKETPSNQCEVCGNRYDKPLDVTYRGQRHTFDCFECAIESLAPRCAHCGCHVVGHGVESEGVICCCAHCAREIGEKGIVDRVL